MLYTETTKTLSNDLINLFLQALDDPLNRLKHNYNITDLKSDENLCYSCTWDEDGDLISGSVVRLRSFYNGGVRILSKYYTSKKLKPIGIRIHRYHTKGISTFAADQADQQIEYVEKLGYFNQFISREQSGIKVMRNMWRGLICNSSHKDWILEPNKWQTAPCDSDECWQNIIWRRHNCLKTECK